MQAMFKEVVNCWWRQEIKRKKFTPYGWRITIWKTDVQIICHVDSPRKQYQKLLVKEGFFPPSAERFGEKMSREYKGKYLA